MSKVPLLTKSPHIDLHDYIYFTYSEDIRDRQLLQNGTNGHSSGYKRVAGNKMATWEKVRKGQVYHFVKVHLCNDKAHFRHLECLQAILA
jgi:hypothetical protein